MCSECKPTPKPQVKCLCWNCGREIYEEDDTYNINEEIWCSHCANATEPD